jgi:hypothetical protein
LYQQAFSPSRSPARTGDQEAARAEYERFLELWKNADQGLPQLEEARRYLARNE